MLISKKVKFTMAEGAIHPVHGSTDAAGWDLYSKNDFAIKIQPHETIMINTGISMEIPKGFVGLVFARSGIASKRGLRPANCVGVIDSDYRGNIQVAMHNDTEEVQQVGSHERIAQIVIMPYLSYTLKEVNELSKTDRGNGGFGSTGSK